MAERSAPIDRSVFVRTSTLFEEKRRALSVDMIQNLARDIVRRVSNMQHVPKAVTVDPVSEESVASFCHLLVRPSSAAALEFLEARVAEGVDHQVILHVYLAEAARVLGEQWETDKISFVDVIHGTGHLYAILRAVQARAGVGRSEGVQGRRALFAAVPDETHTFGVRLAAETFREAGWSIELKVGVDHEALVDHVQRTMPDIIGLSLSTEARLPNLVRLVVALRLVRPEAIIGVAPALNMDDAAIQAVTDIDIIFRDARQAVRDLEWMLQLRS